MNLLGKVSEIMTKHPITVGKEDNLLKVEKIFSENRIHHIPVIDEGKICGIVSKSDYLFFKRGYQEDMIDFEMDQLRMRSWKVKEVMTSKIATMEADERINVAIEVFKENLFHAIPITDNGALVGILSTYDILKTIAIDESIEKKY